LAHIPFTEKDRKTSDANVSLWSILQPAGSKFINMTTNKQSLLQTLPKRNSFPDTLGQHKSLLIVAQSSLGMNSRIYIYHGVKKKPITTRNPQDNAIVEQVHQTIGNIIWTFEVHDNYLDDDDPWKAILAATSSANRATYHTTLQKSPGQLVFGRDMIFNV
jgi:hypothetical protein